MRLNTPRRTRAGSTHEGGRARYANPEQQLRRSVLSCLLWEREFYEEGESIADRIEALAAVVEPEVVAGLAVEARNNFHLRHVPLLLLCALAEKGSPARAAWAVEQTIQRADELAELVAIWWRNGRRPLPAAMKRGLARAFTKFSEYQLAKYNRDGEVKLRDVMFLVHPKPRDAEQAATFKRLADKTLPPPDTWEVALSAGADKRATFERLIREGQLGYLALLRNLRNMMEAGCDVGLVKEAILARRGADRVLPFRYVAAARACPQLEPAIDVALQCAINGLPKLAGRTVVMVDVSGSMDEKLSGKSDMTRLDAAAALASVLNCDDIRTLTFSNQLVEIPPRRGMAGVDAVRNSQPHGGTYLGEALRTVNEKYPCDRLIVITDEQTADRVPDPAAKTAYMVNVASYQNGVGYGRWTHIDGFSENVIRFIAESEHRASAQ